METIINSEVHQVQDGWIRECNKYLFVIDDSLNVCQFQIKGGRNSKFITSSEANQLRNEVFDLPDHDFIDRCKEYIS